MYTFLPILLRGSFRIVVIVAMVITTTAGSAAAEGTLTIRWPTGAVAPTQMEDCALVEQRWNALSRDVNDRHTNCLSGNSPSESGNGTCSRKHCQPLHDAMADLSAGALAEQRRNQREACHAAVQSFQEAERARLQTQQNLERHSQQQKATAYCSTAEDMNGCLNVAVNTLTPAYVPSKQSTGNALSTLAVTGDNAPMGAAGAATGVLGVIVNGLQQMLTPETAEGFAQFYGQHSRESDPANGGLLGNGTRMKRLREAQDDGASAETSVAQLQDLKRSLEAVRKRNSSSPMQPDFFETTQKVIEEGQREFLERWDLYKRQRREAEH